MEMTEVLRKRRILSLLRAAWVVTEPPMRRFAVQAAAKKHQVDCIEAYYEFAKKEGLSMDCPNFLQDLGDCAKHFVYMPAVFVQEVRSEKSVEQMKRLSGYTDTRFLFGPQRVKRR
jgi:hypothetical protein